MNIDPVVFEIGPFTVRWYALIISSALILGMILVLRESLKQGIEEDFFLDFFLWAIPIGIIGARLYFVFFHWSFFRENLGQIIAIWEGGLAIHGGVIGGLLVLIILVKKRKVCFWPIADILAPPLVLGKAIGRWGNFINQEAYGHVVSEEFISYFPEFIQRQMFIGGQYYHPAFLYSFLWNTAVFIFLIWLRRKKFIKPGDVFLSYLVTYSLGRFFIEGIRTDSLMLGPLRVAQLVSGVLIIGATFYLFYRHRKGDSI